MKNLLRRFAICFLTVLMILSLAGVVACNKVPTGNNSSSSIVDDSQSSSAVEDSSASAEDSSTAVEDSSSTSEDSSSSAEDSSSSAEDSSSSVEDSSSEDSSSSSSSGDVDPDPDPDPETLFVKVNGAIEEANGVVTSKMVNSLAILNGGEFVEGTISAKVSLNGQRGDNGIVFGLKNINNLDAYWENPGVYYYFFFLSNAGTAYLGKVSNATWTVCGETPIAGFSANAEYTLEVARDQSSSEYDVIRCYVNGELYVSYKDGEHHDGTGYGIRAGASGVTFSEITVSSEIKGAATTLEGFTIANGLFEESNGAIVSKTGKAIAEKTGGEFVYGTLEVTMSPNGNRTDNGLIFALTPNAIHSYWENDVSYYFFFLSLDGFAFLGKVDNGWETCQYVTVPGYDQNKTYTLKVERDATTIYGYVDGVCYVTYADSFPLTGKGYGVRAASIGVAFKDLKCQSSGEITESYPSDIEVVSGKFLGSNGAARAGANSSLGIVKNASLTEGTFSATIKGVSNKRSGLVFAYSNDGTTESYYRFVSRKEAQRVELDKVVNGVATNLYSNYLSAGYSTGSNLPFKVVIEDGVAYCYFWNTLYTVIDVELSGDKVGLYAEGPASQFSNYTISATPEVVKVDTLLFGHSYFELWSNYKNDLASLASQYNLGSYTNIGIGGSIAAHWYKFKEGLVAYGASKAIYMIGINDLTGGVAPASVVADIKNTLLYMKEINPALTVVLLSVNHCPARSTITTAISQTNVLMQELCASYDWISYAEMEYAFCDDGSTPNSYWFTDGLHPTANGYVQKIVPAIEKALKNEGQPELDEETKLQLLNKAKEIKKGALIDYSEWSYRTAEWATAKPYYDEAIMLIDACETAKEVEDLDLSTIIASLKAIKRNTDYAGAEFISGSNNAVWEAAPFKAALDSSVPGLYNVEHDGHRLTQNVEYTDMSFTFGINEITNEFATIGVLFRATQTAGLGIKGYMINLVTKENYVQVWYFNDSYGADSIAKNMAYIGGWVFPGEVEDTLFRAIVEGNYIYIYTEEDYQKEGKERYGCSVDLSNAGNFAPWTSGYIGINCWASSNGAKGKFVLDNISGNVVEKEAEPEIKDYPNQVVNALKGSTDIYSFNPSAISGGDNGTFTVSGFSYKLYTGLNVNNFSMTVDAKCQTDLGIAGFLFRCKPNGVGDGIDGYLMNFVSNANQQYIQIFYLNNCYNTDGTPVICDYIGGWVFPGLVLQNTFDVVVDGEYITLTAGGHTLSVSLTGAQIGGNYELYTSGGFGILSWQEGLVANLTISSIKA